MAISLMREVGIEASYMRKKRKTTKAAKKLLALKPDSKNQQAKQAKQAAAIALEGRITRAERWAAWERGVVYD